MPFDAWFTIGTVTFTVSLLVFTHIAPDLIMVAGLTLLLTGQVISPADAFAGFSNPGVATVGVLYVVVAGIKDTGGINYLGRRLMGRPKSILVAQLRLMLPVTGVSALLNNTPVVAMMVPVLEEWCKHRQTSVSKFMIPLSYAAILGGGCTLIGTSTNLIVHGLVLKETSLGPMSFFEIARVGLPCAVVGVLFVLLTSRWLLPERVPPFRQQEDAREYTVEMLIMSSSPLVGKTIEEAGLRHLPGVYLAEIQRADEVMPAVEPTERLQARDQLVFVGAVESVTDLVKINGLIPAPDQLFKLSVPRTRRCLIEAVVSDTNPLIGRTIRDGRFRSRYNAVIIAVARNGQRIPGKVGDIELHPGDTLLLESRPAFVERWGNSRDFLLVSAIEESTPPRHERASIAAGILAVMVVIVALGVLSMAVAALIAAGLMILTRCTSASSARANVDWSLLVTIGASIGIGRALQVTGTATAIADLWMGLAGSNPHLMLLVVYVMTSTFTAFVTNNAAAVLIFPIAQASAASLDVSFWPFIVVIMAAASASFATPIGYQTNLMVYGPGGYRFSDYLRIGLPLNVLVAIMTILLVPRFWPF